MSTLSSYGKNSVEKYVKSQVICPSSSMTNSHLWKVYFQTYSMEKNMISYGDRIDLFHNHNLLENICFTLKI